MLKKILFNVAPAITESHSFRRLLHTLDTAQIEYLLSTALEPSPVCTRLSASLKTKFSVSSADSLMITDSSTGIASARNEQLPCIGYAPSESGENMSGAYALFEDFASIDVSYLRRIHAHAAGYPADIFTTERLILREFSNDDFPKLYTMCTEPSTASFMEEIFSDYKTEQEKHTAYIHNVYPFFDLALWGVFERNSGKLIGRAGFSLPEDSDCTFSIGYLIDVPYRGQGYAKELIPALLSYAKEQGYSEISARIKKGNAASVNVLEQCGFPFTYEEDDSKGIKTYVIHLIE